MRFQNFEDILVWQKAKALSIEVYQSFGHSKDYGFRDQIQRASVSVMNNIAEGFERQTNKEFKQFLYISRGSCAEVRSMLYLASDLSFLEEDKTEKMVQKTVEISKMLNGLIKVLHYPTR